MINAVIIGASGRMGQALARAARESEAVRVVAAVDAASSPHLGRDVGELAGGGPLGVAITADLRAALAGADVAIDFSHPDATSANVPVCRAARKALFIGTTGLSASLEPEFEAAAREIPLLVAPNTSLGVTLLIELVREAARALPQDFDIEIVEAHHRYKQDAPSGTALALGLAAAEGRDTTLERSGVMSRVGISPRRTGDIGFAVVRGGDIVGDHTVTFAGAGEQVLLGHRATDRAIFARGALRGAAWLAGQGPGRYAMRDVILSRSRT